jgi:SAM-dependent methyltransferase
MICIFCGWNQFNSLSVLWKQLIDDWQLSEDEVAYINRQQGCHCIKCGANLRSQALAWAIMSCHGFKGLFRDWLTQPQTRALKVLEINEANSLAALLCRLPRHRLCRYPEADMQALPFKDGEFDLVVHSDTLEHIPDPVRGLAECRRVLRPGGYCAFTVPVIVGRLTLSRAGMPPSYHGSPENPVDCLVHTEYGADFWMHAVKAGFSECRLFAWDHPAAHALVGVRHEAAPNSLATDRRSWGSPAKRAAISLLRTLRGKVSQAFQ